MVHFERIFSRAINSLRLFMGDKLYLAIFCHKKIIRHELHIMKFALANIYTKISIHSHCLYIFYLSLSPFMQYCRRKLSEITKKVKVVNVYNENESESYSFDSKYKIFFSLINTFSVCSKKCEKKK